MKRIVASLTLPPIGLVFLCICLGTAGCKKDEPEEEFMTLYDKPLSTIQNCILGKWNWYTSYGGYVAVSYPENVFVEFKDDHYITTYKDLRDTVYFSWEKREIPTGDYAKNETYVLSKKDSENWFFETIRNDTLSVSVYTTSYPRGYGFVRVK
ncbi:MAG: hypothetical protein LBT76_06915 [Tannerella sp.]|nr:hypothetical protein [Tannerella sp.]